MNNLKLFSALLLLSCANDVLSSDPSTESSKVEEGSTATPAGEWKKLTITPVDRESVRRLSEEQFNVTSCSYHHR